MSGRHAIWDYLVISEAERDRLQALGRALGIDPDRKPERASE
jgi:hypothetical protein